MSKVIPFEAFFADFGRGLQFIGQLMQTLLRRGVERKLLFDQIWSVSLQSSSTTAVAGLFVGAIMTVQFTLQVKEFGALGFLGGLATSATIREVGPLLIAFMLSGKVGAFTSAELGTMRVTEQLDAIKCLGSDPMEEIVLPRFLAIVISSFFLLLLGLTASILGGMLMGLMFSGINTEEYIRNIPKIVAGYSIFVGAFKCLCFALLLASVCTYKGYNTTGGARGVGRAVLSTSVVTMVGMVIVDWITSFLADTALSIYLEI